MTALLRLPSAERVQLAPQSIMPGESISSLVDRQAQLWGLPRGQLMSQIAGIHGLAVMKDVDVCKYGDFLDIYAEKTGVDRQLLEKHRAERSEPLLRPTARHAYCPMCFDEDISQGHQPYFRLDWARIFLTHCRKHRCPLFRWVRVKSDGTRRFPYAWLDGEKTEEPGFQQFRQDLVVARGYRYKFRPLTVASVEIWNKLVAFEELLYQKQIGSPTHSYGVSSALSDNALMQTAVLKMRTFVTDDHHRDAIQIAYEESNVMNLLFKPQAVHQVAPSWRDIRSGAQSIAHRRAVIYGIAGELLT